MDTQKFGIELPVIYSNEFAPGDPPEKQKVAPDLKNNYPNTNPDGGEAGILKSIGMQLAEARKILDTEGGVESILERTEGGVESILERLGSGDAFFYNACSILQRISCMAGGSQAIVSVGGVPVIVEIIKKTLQAKQATSDSIFLCQIVCSILKRISLIEDGSQEIMDAAGVPAIIQAINVALQAKQATSNAISLCQTACPILWEISRIEGGAQTIMDAAGVPAIIQAINVALQAKQATSNAIFLCYQACPILKEITCIEAGSEAIMDAAGVPAIVQVINTALQAKETTPDYIFLCQLACFILWKISDIKGVIIEDVINAIVNADGVPAIVQLINIALQTKRPNEDTLNSYVVVCIYLAINISFKAGGSQAIVKVGGVPTILRVVKVALQAEQAILKPIQLCEAACLTLFNIIKFCGSEKIINEEGAVAAIIGVVIQNRASERDNENRIHMEQAFEVAMHVLTEIAKTPDGIEKIRSSFEENQFSHEKEQIPALLAELLSTTYSGLLFYSFLAEIDNQVPAAAVETDNKPSAAEPQT